MTPALTGSLSAVCCTNCSKGELDTRFSQTRYLEIMYWLYNN